MLVIKKEITYSKYEKINDYTIESIIIIKAKFKK
jgi:hypothetical protein